MTNFIEFRKEYLVENPGSYMTKVREEYYKSIGKALPPLKTSRKASKKTSRKVSKKTSRKASKKTSRKASKKTSRKVLKKTSRKVLKKTSRKVGKNSLKKKINQSGGEKISNLYKTPNLIRNNMHERVPDVYGISDTSKRTELVNISNLIQDLSLYINNTNKINDDIDIDNFKISIKKLSTKLNNNLNQIKKLSDNIDIKSNINIKSISTMNIDNIHSINKTKNELEKIIDNSKELYNLTTNMETILGFINNNLDSNEY